MELIDKSALVAEIEKYKVRAQPSYYGCGRLSVCEDLINFINTLEVKEVDLEKEFENFVVDDTVIGNLVNFNAAKIIAKHFFELGLKTKKGE